MKSVVHANEADWKRARMNTIGASEIGVICGLSRFKSPYTLWCEKKGLIPAQEETIRLRTGHALEPMIAELYEDATGEKLFDPGHYTICAHDDYSWLTCTPDRVIASHIMGDWIPEKPVELKTMGRYYAKTVADGDAPDPYKIQIMTQMAILDCEVGDLACLIDNAEFEIYPFERHDRLIKGIVKQAKEFWDRLQNDDPPPVDGSYSTACSLALRWHRDNGECIELPEGAASCLDRLIELKAKIKELESEKGACENIIKAALGDATRGESWGLSVTWKQQKREGYIKVAEEYEDALLESNIPFKEVNGSQVRVLRTGGKSE